jgi:putative ABC transport system ATP-binding protein
LSESPSRDRADRARGIAVRGVRKTYRTGERTVEALRGIDLDIAAPGVFGIMGASGSGKSTLLHLIAGLDRPDAGSIEVDGLRIDSLPERDLTLYRRRRIGIVFQQFNLLPTLTALENAILPGTLDRLDRDACLARGRTLLGELGLSNRVDHRPEALSGGEQQRVAIARSLFFDPPILLADEPTGNLDSRTSERLWDLLGSIAESRRMLVVLVTHEPAAAAHCRVVHVMRDGRLAGSIDVASLDPSHRSSELALRAAELGRAAG